MKAVFALVFILLSVPGGIRASGYNIIFQEPNPGNPADRSKWTFNGTLGNAGASIISTVPIPDGTADYEIRSNLTLYTSGGTFGHLIHASPDATTQTGTSFLTELQNPTFSANGLCSAALVS